jgi:hypothetical protein
LLAWAASGLLGYAEGIAATSAWFIPLPPELVYWIAGLMSGAGGVLVWVVWFLGAAVIAIVTMVLLALFRRRDPGFEDGARYETMYEPARQDSRDGMRAPASGESRSGEEIVARVLGKSTRR